MPGIPRSAVSRKLVRVPVGTFLDLRGDRSGSRLLKSLQ